MSRHAFTTTLILKSPNHQYFEHDFYYYVGEDGYLPDAVAGMPYTAPAHRSSQQGVFAYSYRMVDFNPGWKYSSLEFSTEEEFVKFTKSHEIPTVDMKVNKNYPVEFRFPPGMKFVEGCLAGTPAVDPDSTAAMTQYFFVLQAKTPKGHIYYIGPYLISVWNIVLTPHSEITAPLCRANVIHGSKEVYQREPDIPGLARAGFDAFSFAGGTTPLGFAFRTPQVPGPQGAREFELTLMFAQHGLDWLDPVVKRPTIDIIYRNSTNTLYVSPDEGVYKIAIACSSSQDEKGGRFFCLVDIPVVALKPDVPALKAQRGINFKFNLAVKGWVAPYKYYTKHELVASKAALKDANGNIVIDLSNPEPAITIGQDGEVTGTFDHQYVGKYSLSIVVEDHEGFIAVVDFPCEIIESNLVLNSTLEPGVQGLRYLPQQLHASWKDSMSSESAHPVFRDYQTGSVHLHHNGKDSGLTVSESGLVEGFPHFQGGTTLLIEVEERSEGHVKHKGVQGVTLHIWSQEDGFTRSSLPPRKTETYFQYQKVAPQGGGYHEATLIAGELPPGVVMHDDYWIMGTPSRDGNYQFAVSAKETNAGPKFWFLDEIHVNKRTADDNIKEALSFELLHTDITAHTGDIWISGYFAQQLTIEPIFEFSIGGGAFRRIAEANVRHSKGDHSFTILLPDSSFPGGDHNAAKIYSHVKIRVGYIQKDAFLPVYTSGDVTITIANGQALFDLVKNPLQMIVKDGSYYLAAKGTVRGPKGEQDINPVTRVAISWDGSVTDGEIKWQSTQGLVPGEENVWNYYFELLRTDFKGTLNPILLAQTKGGAKFVQHVTFHDATGLIDVTNAIKQNAQAIVPNKNTSVYKVKDGEEYSIEFTITPKVGLKRINVGGELHGAQVERVSAKSIQFTPSQTGRYGHSWNGYSSRQLFSLSELKTDSSYVVVLPIKIVPGARGICKIVLSLEDPEAQQQAFFLQTDHIVTLQIE